ncbi:MAG: hypothetical protein CL878_14340 [Dehalococcoidia bacterium]|nr:hypothetical protein [Dehalococcoidia bacterium]
MRLLIVGCEYAGKTTLARVISQWMIAVMGLRMVRWHNHFVVPRLDGHLLVRAEGDITAIGKEAADLNTAEDEEQIMALRPSVLEQLQRHNIWRHLHPDLFRDDDTLFVNHYYADAVYAPIYYSYGESGSFSDRRARARAWDAELLERAPETVLVLVRAAAETIKDRMRQTPRVGGILRKVDVPHVLDCFDREYKESLIHRKFALDTTDASADATFEQFLEHVRPHLSTTDQRRMTQTPGSK